MPFCHCHVCTRNYFSALVGSEAPASVSAEVSESELPWKVLESLFNTPKSSEQKPDTMNWRNVVKKMEALGKSSQICTSVDDKERTHPHGIFIACVITLCFLAREFFVFLCN